MRILVAEDDNYIALALKTLITRNIQGSEVVVVKDGNAAYDEYRERKPELILSDWNMPKMSGQDLLSRIRIHNQDTRTPFLMLTARADTSSVREAISSGVTEYVVKPFDKSMLLEKINQLLEEAGALNQQDAAPVEDLLEQVGQLIRTRINKHQVEFPVLPGVAFRAVEVINAEDVSMSSVAEVIKLDTSIASKVLSLANSVHFRGQKPIDVLDDAIKRIGLRETMHVVLIYSMKELYRDEDQLVNKLLYQLWELALYTSAAAKEIALKTGETEPERFYCHGLFYDIGQWLVLVVMIELRKNRSDIDESLIMAAMYEYGRQAGVALSTHWGFSKNILRVIRTSSDYSDLATSGRDAWIVVLANHLAFVSAKEQESPHSAATIKMLNAELGLSDDEVVQLQQDTAAYLRGVKLVLV